MRTSLVILASVLAAIPASAATRILTAQMEVAAPIEKAWGAWTTREGVESFFASQCLVEPQVDGRYEIYFIPENPPGQRGAEGTRILCLEPMRRFAFTWDAPITIPEIRRQRTMCVVEFIPIGTESTSVRFTHLGWGEGAAWDEAYSYFNRAWNERVLPRFVYVMARGPVDWGNLPDLKPVAPTMIMDLVETR